MGYAQDKLIVALAGNPNGDGQDDADPTKVGTGQLPFDVNDVVAGMPKLRDKDVAAIHTAACNELAGRGITPDKS